MICTVSHSTDHIFNNLISEFIYLNVTVILYMHKIHIPSDQYVKDT